jgi:N-acetylglutamate synthase-like GNAT family acetyltransferase
MSMAQNTDQLSAQADLLLEVFPDGALSFEYLDWLYRKSPDGVNLASDYVESSKLLGHYTIIPQCWRIQRGTKRLALSLNTAVHHEARGKGLFVQLAEQTYSHAATSGVQAIIGVANANSTPGFVRRLGFTLLKPLPVVAGLVMPIRSRSTISHTIDPKFLESERFSQIAAGLETDDGEEAEQEWSVEKLRWRLSSPRTQYALHVHESGILITTTSLHFGLKVVVALKFIPNLGITRIDVRRLVKQAASHHRTPCFIYCGFNKHAMVRGAPLPRRFLPSPLNLIYRRLDQSMPQASEVVFGTFEFLDFDAY